MPSQGHRNLYRCFCSTRNDFTKWIFVSPHQPSQCHVVNKPFTSSSAEARLRLYLKEAGLDEGETLHRFRSGSTIISALSGSQLADIMDHVGWQSNSMTLYYLKLAQVLRPGGPSHVLASQDEDSLCLSTNYVDLNSLKNFVSAFPVSSQANPLKRSSSV